MIKAVAILTLIHLCGAAVNWTFFKGLGSLLAGASGIFTGLLLWVVITAVNIAAKMLFGMLDAPLSLDGILYVTVGIGLASVALSWRRGWAQPVPWLEIAAATGVFAVCAAAAVFFNAAVLSADSFDLVNLANGVIAAFEESGKARLGFASYNVFMPAALSISGLVGMDYAYFIVPALSYAFVPVFMSAGHRALTELGLPPFLAWLFPVTATMAGFSGYFVIFSSQYINANAATGFYTFLFFYAAWLGQRRNDAGLIGLAGLMLVGVGLLRVEGPLFVAMYAGVFWSFVPRGTRLTRALVPGLAFTLVWLLVVYVLSGKGSDIGQPVRFLGMAGALTLVSLALIYGADERIDRLRRQAPALVLSGLGVTAVIMSVLDPPFMATSVFATMANMLYASRWGVLWGGLAAIWLFLLIAQPEQGETMISTCITLFFLLLWVLAYIRGWPFRIGWGDSANRMLLHILPTVIFFPMTGMALLWRGAADQRNGNRPDAVGT